MRQQTDNQKVDHTVPAESPLSTRDSREQSVDDQPRTAEACVQESGVISKHEMPDTYVNAFGNLYYDEYIVFSATQSDCGEQITVVCPVGSEAEKNVVREWTGAENVDEVVGHHIPVRQVRGDTYRIEPFGGLIMGKLPLQLVKGLCERELLTFDGTDWQTSPVVRAFNTSVYLGAVSPFLLVLYTALQGSVGGISTMFAILSYGIFLSGWLLGYGRME